MFLLLLLLRRLLTLGFFLRLSLEKIEEAVPLFRGRLSPRGGAMVVGVRTDVRFGNFSPAAFGVFGLFINLGVV